MDSAERIQPATGSRLSISSPTPVPLEGIYRCRLRKRDVILISDQNENENKLNTEIVDNYSCLPPENEIGNVEYKSKLINPSASRLQHLTTQMKWRLREGAGEAIYEIGVEDDGTIVGLTEEEMNYSMDTLKQMADNIGATLEELNETVVHTNSDSLHNPRKVAKEILVRKLPDNRKLVDLRLAILGAADSGKSTLCGILTSGVLDDGQGKTRLNLFRFRHEFRSGKTSSICLDVVGFSSDGELVNYKEHTLEEVIEKSARLITLIDLAGDGKYLKTTIYGVSGYNPNYCALVVNSKTGATSITREHLGLALALEIPIFVILTKLDLVTTSQREKVLQNIERLIRNLGKNLTPRRVACKEDVAYFAASMQSKKLLPIFSISNVSGADLDLLIAFLNLLPPVDLSVFKQKQLTSSGLPLFYIDEIFKPDKVRIVVCGILSEGAIHEGDHIQVGPNKSGLYLTGTVESIHRNKQPVHEISAENPITASLGLTLLPSDSIPLPALKRGMIIISCNDVGICCKRFVARFCLLHHPTNEICVGFQGTVYIGSLCRTASIIDFDANSIRPCEWIVVTFEFIQQPEFLRVGMPLIFRERRTKGMGEVTEIRPVQRA